MIYKVFLDVNIIIDFFVATRLHHKDAVEIFSFSEKKLLKSYISESVINTTAWLLRKDHPVKALRDIFLEMLDIFTILPCNEHSCRSAMHSIIPDIEDAILYQIAVQGKMDYFISNDKTDFKNVNQKILPVVNSGQFIALLKSSPSHHSQNP